MKNVIRYGKASCLDTEPTYLEKARSKTFWSVNPAADDNIKAVFDSNTGDLIYAEKYERDEYWVNRDGIRLRIFKQYKDGMG